MDLDGDGHADLLSGSYSRMEKSMAGLFQVLHGTSDGSFKTAKVLKGTDNEPLIIPIKDSNEQTENICTRPSAVDWDSDGDLDLVVGNFAGSFYVFYGEGKGKFQPKPQLIKSGEEALKISGAHSDPFVIDWDKDGDLDLVSGSSNGGVQWSENTAGKGELPTLKPFVALIEPERRTEYGAMLNEGDLRGPTTSTRIWIDDVNEDGKLDILVGDSVTLVSRAKGVSAKEFEKKSAEWKEAFNKALVEMQSAKATKERQEASQRYNELYQQRSKFIKEDRTGFVWLYVQK